MIGVFGLFKEKLTIDNAPILIFLFAGAGITFFTIMYNFKVPHFEIVQENLDFFFSAFCLTFTFCLGLGFAIVAIVDKRYKKTHCIYPVEAYCTSLGEDSLSPSLHNFNEDFDNIYSPSWKYTYQGKEYTYKSSYGSNITPPDKGDVYTIYIDPDNPEKAWVPQFSNHANFLMIGIIAIIISVVGMYCINFLM